MMNVATETASPRIARRCHVEVRPTSRSAAQKGFRVYALWASEHEIRTGTREAEFEHEHLFATRRDAESFANRVRAANLTDDHLFGSDHWTRCGRMSGCVQVGPLRLEILSRSADGLAHYRVVGDVQGHWGLRPRKPTVWASHEGASMDSDEELARRFPAEPAGSVHLFHCDSYRRWPYGRAQG